MINKLTNVLNLTYKYDFIYTHNYCDRQTDRQINGQEAVVNTNA